jgi:hypothetical protein
MTGSAGSPSNTTSGGQSGEHEARSILLIVAILLLARRS